MRKPLIAAPMLAIALGFASPAGAFSCPAHFADAQAAIDRAVASMGEVTDGAKKGLVHTLIDDARALLASAKHNHEKPAAGAYDHARSLAKADSARSYAEAAEALAERS